MRKLEEDERGSVYFSSTGSCAKKRKTPIQFEKVVRNALNDQREFGINGCWLWQGGKTKEGYGVFWWTGRAFLVHRIAYELDKGEIPAGKILLHSCDIPPCFNPAHLYPGTQKENVEDMMAKSRDRFFGRTKSGLQIRKEKRQRGEA